MSRTTAGDRLDDSYPHGTPAGFRDGCRGNGACPNRGTRSMTCKEAAARYASDLHYRRAYDAGDIWLDRTEPLDEAKEKAHDAALRRAGHHKGTPDDPKPAPVRAVPWSNLVVAQDAQLTVAPTAPTPRPPAGPKPEPTELQRAQARIVDLETQLAYSDQALRRSQALAATASQERDLAVGTRQEVQEELGRVRATLAQVRATSRMRVKGSPRADLEIRQTVDGPRVHLSAALDPATIQALAAGLQPEPA